MGTTLPELGGSEYYEQVHNHVGGRVPRVNLKTEAQFHKTLLRTVRSGQVKATHDCSKGGLAVALAEMAILRGHGFKVNLDLVPHKTKRLDQLLFSETKPRFILETHPRNTTRVLAMLKRSKVPASKIGQVKGEQLGFQAGEEEILTLPVSAAKDAWSNSIPRAMEATL